MKASELIEKLKDYIEKFGDREIDIPKTDGIFRGYREADRIVIHDSENVFILE